MWRPLVSFVVAFSSVVSFVVVMNRVDVVDRVADLVDVDLVDVDLPCDSITRQECFRLLSFEKCFKTN